MFTKFSNSWNLMKASWGVLKQDKELIVFPILSTIAVIVVTLSFALPIFLIGETAAQSLKEFGVVQYIIGFLFYFVQYFIIIFCNTALVGAAMIRLRGGNPTVGDGFRIAGSRILTILGYSFIAATVGMILRSISERSGLLGKIVVSLLSMAWSLATFLVIPVFIVENVGPIEAIKRSTQLLKKTWGEQIVGNISIGFAFGVIMFALIIAMVFAMIAFAEVLSTGMLVMVISAFVLAFILLALISSTLGSIYEAAVYIYASEGKVSGFFEEDLVKEAFRLK